MTRVALVHEWFTTLAGSEKVVEQFCSLYPEADLFSIYADPAVVRGSAFLRDRNLTTSFIQGLPGARRHFRSYLPLMPIAVEQFDMSPYELVISSSHAVAKGVITGPDQLHISYVHSPIRYAWDLQHQYLRETGLQNGLKGLLAKWLLHKIRIWDYRTAAGVDHFVANSQFVARRIAKVYGRQADVIYPPVDVSAFAFHPHKESFYLAASRMVPYKKMDLIAEAFTAMPDLRLVIVGDGPEMDKVKAKCGANVEVLGHQGFATLKDLMQRARAFVFAAEEDFGITPVEAQACGTPVIAYGKGGALETIRGGADGTGLFFDRQTTESICTAVRLFESGQVICSAETCRANAERFSTQRFKAEFEAFVASKLSARAT